MLSSYTVYTFHAVLRNKKNFLPAYHTCLYLWARDVEKAQVAGQPMQVAAPAPLAAVLS